jgi:plasmid stabilization system protein ParE
VSFTVRPSRQFRKDAAAIIEFVGHDNAEAARIVFNELARKIGLLRARPLAFRLRPELGNDIRVVQVFRYIVAYRVEGPHVFLERMVHMSRDLETLFPGEDT